MNAKIILAAAVLLAAGAAAASVAVSPDGRNRIDCEGGRITVRRDGRTLFGPQAVALALDRGAARVELTARDDGVAYRFVTDEDGEVTVRDETAELVFPSPDTEIWAGLNWCDNPSDPKQDKLQHGCSSIYSRLTPATFPPDGRRLAYLPLTVRFADGTTALVTESDLRDYAGLHLRRDGGDTNRLRGVFGKYPVVEKERPEYKQYRRVTERRDYIVRTRGRRTFPWRVFALADRPIGIVEQRIVRDLAAPASGDWSWVRPGPCAWEWWNACHLEDVPFKPGINTATYCAYADFAADYGLPWMLVDEGWNDGLDLRKIVPAFDLDAIVRHAAARKKVQVMLWTAWRTIDGRQEDYFAHFAQRGVKGFKIDFMERDDAEMVNFMERTLQVAAKCRLCIDFHGSGKPTGLEKTYPNLIGMEGVHGLELMKLAMARNDDFLTHDCQVVFTRAPLGLLDYTPGAMCNRLRKDWKPDFANPCSQGTRVRQMALYTLFPVPLQMLCDSPSRYRRNPECTRFIASVPTVWDETKGLCGEIGRFAAVARRSGREWWIGAITDAEPRTLALDTSFLGRGRWRAEVFADADDAGVQPEHWRRTVVEFVAGEPLPAKLASGGGWTARLTPLAAAMPLTVTLTFDDGVKGHLQYAAPMLEKFGWRGTFNIVTDWIGGDKKLSWDEVRELHRRGHEIASHTKTHPFIRDWYAWGKTNELVREFAESRDVLKREVGVAPRHLCHPYTHVSAGIDALIRAQGMEPYTGDRFNVGGDVSPAELAKTLDGWIAGGVRSKDILFHGITAETGGWKPFASARDFEACLAEIRKRELAGRLRVVSYGEYLRSAGD